MNFENDLHDEEPPEREISLGTATIIGIFLALALVCAAFFGFGYSLGRHAAPASVAAAAEPRVDMKPDTTFSNFKTAPSPATESEDSTGAQEPAADGPAPVAVRASNVKVPVPDRQPAPVVAAPLPTASSTGQFVVQVSATTRQSDADSLLAALKRKGYTAAIKNEADNRFHVQVGPFATKAEAEVMRKQLDADGYKGPFIK